MEMVFTITLILVAAGIFLAGYFVTQPLRPAKIKPASTVHDNSSDGGTVVVPGGLDSSSFGGDSSGGD